MIRMLTAFSLTFLFSCTPDSVEKEVSKRLLGRWQPIAFYVAPEKIIQNLKPGWNLTNSMGVVSFSSDGKLYSSIGIVGSAIPYHVMNEHQFRTIADDGTETIYQFEFKSDTLLTLTDCTDHFYCGWKYISPP